MTMMMMIQPGIESLMMVDGNDGKVVHPMKNI